MTEPFVPDSEVIAHNALRNLNQRVARARRFPANTCSASRHLHLIARALAAGKPYPMLEEEPQHCAETMLSVLESPLESTHPAQSARGEVAMILDPAVLCERRRG